MRTLGFVVGVALACAGGALAAKEAAKQHQKARQESPAVLNRPLHR
jgi:hypothetical protein